MPKANVPLLAFNRGEVSPLALSRFDVERVRLSAETMLNWVPKTQGAMRIRSGLGYKGATKSNAAAQIIEFVAATDDTALIEITNGVMRVWVDDELVTRGSVSTSISNGSFASATGWTDGSTGGGVLTFGGTGLILDATNRGGIAKCTREVTVAAGDQNDEHGLYIVVTRGPVMFRCGSAAGADDYIGETRLLAGYHKLAFTPTGNFHLTLFTRLTRDVIVASIAVESSGTVELTAPWLTADIDKLQWSQSADVVFVACDGYRQKRIERRAVRSWSIVDYLSDDGPFIGKTADVRLKPGHVYGNTTLTADASFFTASHVGCLFRLFHKGQSTSIRLGAEDTFTDPIRVSGVKGEFYDDRVWGYAVTGTWVGTLTVERSFDGPDFGYSEYPNDQSSASTVGFTGNATVVNEDEDFNSIIWYRIGFQTGDFTSGAAVVALSYAGGGGYGVCRVTGFTSATEVNVEILKPMFGTAYTDDWSEGSWSAAQEWPTSVALHEGRLWWFGGAQIFGSVSDDYESFDQDIIGDAGPIIRTIGEGPVDSVNWALSLDSLVLGTAGGELSMRSSTQGEPLTPSSNSVRTVSTQGSAAGLRAVRLDGSAIYVQRSGKRVYELMVAQDGINYQAVDLTLLHPEIAAGGIASIAIQRQPDTRVHIVLENGTALILTYEPSEEVLCWSRVQTDGTIERVAVLPGTDEDQVYYVVNRTVDGSTVRYLEKWALESETLGDDLCKLADSFVVYDSTAATSIPVAHLEGESVIVWADGNVVEEEDDDGVWAPKLHTVDNGVITLSTAASEVVVGLPYTATYKSTKLAYAAGGGTALTQPKRVNYLGLVLSTTHHRGLEFGPSFDVMDALPQVHEGAAVTTGTVYSEFDAPAVEFPGEYDTDARICLRATAPMPCTVMAAVVGMATHDKG